MGLLNLAADMARQATCHSNCEQYEALFLGNGRFCQTCSNFHYGDAQEGMARYQSAKLITRQTNTIRSERHGSKTRDHSSSSSSKLWNALPESAKPAAISGSGVGGGEEKEDTDCGEVWLMDAKIVFSFVYVNWILSEASSFIQKQNESEVIWAEDNVVDYNENNVRPVRFHCDRRQKNATRIVSGKVFTPRK